MSAVTARVVLAEDGVLLREGLIQVLGRFGFTVVDAVGDAEHLITSVGTHEPDLVITDIKMPPAFHDEGLRAAVQLRRMRPGLPVVVLSQYVQQEYAADLIGTGDGVGYLLKDRVADIEEFVAALRTVLAGGTVVDPEVVRRLLHRPRDPLGMLSPREREVLGLIAEGRSNSSIAGALFVTETAVGKHVGNILAKLGLPPTDDTNRRVMAVLTYLGARVG
ncbi:DNA-binding response regulator [Actinoplanes ianthinogenes]|uniref:DNA-binding response regulator n=1 Tax=Actinoplanes ianthinogenes TaxID=122358 RepID=A0ABN6CBI2_9ACTN|nr:response regulator transcription factor [Actinoplanes ianthinogenes]BCJ41724.1 DNA-binding response regulator [Actinoplanes ianthinogenes]GGR28159.1 DNA-binding response regulator [Actinoplanes ianthinogenes]